MAFFFDLFDRKLNFVVANDQTNKSSWTSENLYQQGNSTDFPTGSSNLVKLQSIEVEYISYNINIRMTFSNGDFTVVLPAHEGVQRLATVTGKGFCRGGNYGFGYWQRTKPTGGNEAPIFKRALFYNITTYFDYGKCPKNWFKTNLVFSYVKQRFVVVWRLKVLSFFQTMNNLIQQILKQ